MAAMIRLELLKLRRTSLLWVGVAAGMLAILISFYLAAADRMTQYTVAIFMGNIVSNNQSSLFPFVAVLTVGRMMEWERTSHTLRGILTVPVSFPALLAAKLEAGVLLTMGYSLLQWVLGVGCCLVLHLPGVEAGALLRDLLVLAASSLCVYIAVLPVAALSAQFAGGYAAGTVFAVFYGFCSIFVEGGTFSALYPICSGTVLLGLGNSVPVLPQRLCALLSLGAMLAVGVILTVTARDRQTRRKPSARPQKARGRRR